MHRTIRMNELQKGDVFTKSMLANKRESFLVTDDDKTAEKIEIQSRVRLTPSHVPPKKWVKMNGKHVMLLSRP